MRLDGQRRPLAGAAWTAAARECSHLPVHVHVRVHVRVRVRVHVHVHVRVRVRVHAQVHVHVHVHVRVRVRSHHGLTCASEMAAMRRGCVTTIEASPPRPAATISSRMYCGTCNHACWRL